MSVPTNTSKTLQDVALAALFGPFGKDFPVNQNPNPDLMLYGKRGIRSEMGFGKHTIPINPRLWSKKEERT